ncbi:MAG: DUF2550 domain-containing protein [Lapillicoccus sp.]
MPSVLVSAEVLVGVLAALVGIALLVVFVRRRAIARDNPLTLCGVRRLGGTRWRLGLLRLGPTRLEWFPLLGVTLRPSHGWERLGLDVDAPVRLEGVDRIDLLPDAVGIRCYYDDRQFDLALQPPHYTALRSWLEAAPPGSRANVA